MNLVRFAGLSFFVKDVKRYEDRVENGSTQCGKSSINFEDWHSFCRTDVIFCAASVGTVVWALGK